MLSDILAVSSRHEQFDSLVGRLELASSPIIQGGGEMAQPGTKEQRSDSVPAEDVGNPFGKSWKIPSFFALFK